MEALASWYRRFISASIPLPQSTPMSARPITAPMADPTPRSGIGNRIGRPGPATATAATIALTPCARPCRCSSDVRQPLGRDVKRERGGVGDVEALDPARQIEPRDLLTGRARE